MSAQETLIKIVPIVAPIKGFEVHYRNELTQTIRIEFVAGRVGSRR